MREVCILVLGNGAAGAEKQALSLSSRLHAHLRQVCPANVSPVAPQLVRVEMKDSAYFRNLPPALQIAGARLTRDPFFGYATTDEQKRVLLGRDDRQPTRKRVLIGCGRTTVSLNAALRQPWTAAEGVFNIQIQHPHVPLRLFDAVITPHHDALKVTSHPANLFFTLGTVCSIDQASLQREGDRWRRALGEQFLEKKVRLAWLIGGPCRGFSFSERDVREMTDQVLRLVNRNRSTTSLMVTFSRRTPQEARVVIENRLNRELLPDQLYVWDGHGANPYEAMLHHATGIVTTPDSISMTTEAIASGKPVFTVCADRIQGKFRHFHDRLFAHGFSSQLSLEASPDLPRAPPPRGQQAIADELDRLVASLSARILRE